MRTLIPLILAACLVAAVSGCASTSAGTQPLDGSLQQQAMSYLESGQTKAALNAAEKFTRESPDDYQSWLTLNAVHLVMRDYQTAHTDNVRALEVFQASPDKYPEQERKFRRARIEESFALTALIASRRSSNAEEYKAMTAVYEKHSALLKELDEDAWKNLRALAGEKQDQ